MVRSVDEPICKLRELKVLQEAAVVIKELFDALSTAPMSTEVKG